MGVDHDVGAQSGGQILLVGVFGGGDDRSRLSQRTQGGQRAQPHRSRPQHRYGVPRLDLGFEGSMDPAGRGLQHDGRFIGEIVGHLMKLALMGDKSFSPAAAGARAEADLDAVLDGATEQVAVILSVAGVGTGEGKGLVAGRRSQNRF